MNIQEIIDDAEMLMEPSKPPEWRLARLAELVRALGKRVQDLEATADGHGRAIEFIESKRARPCED